MSQDMDGALHTDFAKSLTIWDSLTKISAYLQLRENEFSPDLEGVAQKLDLPCSFDVLEAFGGKSKSKASRALKFCTKWIL